MSGFETRLAALQLGAGEENDFPVGTGAGLDAQSFLCGLDSRSPIVELYRAQGHAVPCAKMVRLHINHEFTEFHARRVMILSKKQRGMFVDWLSPAGKLAAQAMEHSFGIDQISAFHQRDSLLDLFARFGPFFIEPAFP